MYVEASGRIFVETFHEDYERIKPFLISCCEPVCRTTHVNEYIILPTSLAAAASEGVFSESDIRAFLKRYAVSSGINATQQRKEQEECSGVESGSDRRQEEQKEEEFIIPEPIERMLQASGDANRLRVLLERSHRYAEGDEAGGTAKKLTYYLASNNQHFIEKVINSSAEIRRSLVAQPSSADTRQGRGGAEEEEADFGTDSSCIDGIRWTFSDLEDYEVPLTDGEVLLRRQEAAMQARLEGKVESHQLRADLEEQSCLPQAGRSTVTATRLVHKAEVAAGCLRKLRREIQENLRVHIDCSYDHSTDTLTKSVPNFRLKPTTKLRFYQEQSLERFQSKGRVRNGIVVLPCGAGKSLTGIAAASMVGKPVIVMCINVQSVLQWRDQFLTWSTLTPDQISICTADDKQIPKDVFITTYSMLTAKHATKSGVRSVQSLANEAHKNKIFEEIRNKSWGLLVLDEVHTAPADSFQKVIDRVTAHCVLGLTATLLREDGKIVDLDFLVGPKLFEANWLELAKAGHLATVHCAEIRCHVPVTFLQRYAVSEEKGARIDIECMNPVKLWSCQSLIQFHTETRSPSDKIIIFCDSRVAIRYYALRLGVPFMDGATSHEERGNLLEHFRKNPRVNVLLISRVGDTALDLPEANVIIQVNGMFGSRRQEAQRLGRILRPKPPSMDSSSAFFYTLVSTDTDEERFTFPRQQWLREQGFAYRVLGCDDILNFYRDGRGPTMPQRPLVCVGPPVWCVKVTREAFAALKHYQYLPDDAGGEHHHHAHTKYPPYVGHWLTLDEAASELLDRAFTRGRSVCLVSPPHGAMRPATPIPISALSVSGKGGRGGMTGLTALLTQGQGLQGTHGTLVLPVPDHIMSHHHHHHHHSLRQDEDGDEETVVNVSCYLRRGAGDISQGALIGATTTTEGAPALYSTLSTARNQPQVHHQSFTPEQHLCSEYCMEWALNTFRPPSVAAQSAAMSVVAVGGTTVTAAAAGRGGGRGGRTGKNTPPPVVSSFGGGVARPEAKRPRS